MNALLRTCRWLLLSIGGLVVGNTAIPSQDAKRPDILIADFEGKDYGDWKTTGEAFGPGPAQGTLPGQMHVDGYKGKGLVNSFFKGDASVGTLTSPEFKVERDFIAFLIGGGKNTKNLALNLLVGGKVVRSSTGPNDSPGGSETLTPESWDVREFAGKVAVIQVVDNAKGGWGHINVDHIVQSDRQPPPPPIILTNAKREFKVDSRYINIPIKNGAKPRVVTLIVDGKPFVQNTIELADDKADWWAPMDVSAWKGKTITLMVDKLAENSSALKNIDASDTIKNGENLYKETLRGQFHFSPKRGWNNDPNGMVYFNGEYHLFFQHNPYGWGWGNMHWGQAVSKDMVHWEELGDKLLPDAMGPMFSGCAVVDWNNTSGFGKDGKPPLVLLYTAAGNPTVQCIASSTDGRSFTKYEQNPVVKQITAGNRDPKVIWHEPTKKWVMVLYVEINKKHTIHFLTSPNLKEWTLASVTKNDGKGTYLFECPDFFELPVDGNAKDRKWVLMGANAEYAIGTFDGTAFKPEHSKLPGQHGTGFYAPQTFSDIPARDGRRIQIGWFQTATVGMPFNQSMTIPQELKLIATAAGPRLTRAPIKELEALRAKSHTIKPLTLRSDAPNPLTGVNAELIELQAEFEPTPGSEVTFMLRGAKVRYDAAKQELVVNGRRAPAPLRNGKQRLTIFVDRTGLEVFASEGLTYVPMPFAPKKDAFGLAVGVQGGDARVTALQVHELRSAWKLDGPTPVRQRVPLGK
jgi:fructan beta-fructosidase